MSDSVPLDPGALFALAQPRSEVEPSGCTPIPCKLRVSREFSATYGPPGCEL